MKGGYLGETPPCTKFSCGALCLECLVHPKGFLCFKVRLKSPPPGRRLCSPPPLICHICLNIRWPCVSAADFSYYGCSLSQLFFFFKLEVLFNVPLGRVH